MKRLRAIASRFGTFVKGHQPDDDLREELEAHLEMETAELIRRGMSPAEARRKALLASGGLTSAVEAVRDQRSLPSIENMGADFRYAARALRRSPAFTAIVVVTLALGIGANTAIFSVVRGVLLKPLPHRDGERLLYLRQSMDGPNGSSITFSVPEVRDFRSGTPSLSGIAEYSQFPITMQGDDEAIRINTGLVTGNYFEVMGLSPILGRVTRPGDDGTGVPPVIVLTHEFWSKQFKGDSTIVGRQIRLDNTPVTVIGVLQRAPTFPDRVDALMNMVISAHHTGAQMANDRIHRMTEVVARIAPGATRDQALSEIAATYARMQRDHKEAYPAESHYRMEAIPFRDAIGERARLTLWLLMAAAAFVMIIASANVINLTLMRGVRREQEMVVRAALGAGVQRLRRLLMAENLLLTLGGAMIGVCFAIGGVRLLVLFAQRYSQRANEVKLDASVLAFSLFLALSLALLLSYVASVPREGALASWISAGVRRISGSLRKQRVQRVLVVAQIAVSVVLLAGAGLLTRTMIQLSEVNTGLRTENVLTMQVPLLELRQVMNPAWHASTRTRYDALRDEVKALPGVIEVGIGSTMPLRESGIEFEMSAEGVALGSGEAPARPEYRTANPEYFRAAGIPIVKGREFASTDVVGSGRVIIINQALADKMFQGVDPIGKRVAFTGAIMRLTPISTEWRTVVGVSGNTQDGGLDAEPHLVAFTPFAQEPTLGAGLVIRTENDAAGFTAAATKIVRRLAPGVPILSPMTVAQIKDQSVAPRRLNALLISSFGLLAVVIAAVGIAGVLAFSVSTRTSEIGIRMSLGANRSDVQRMILREGGVLLVAGLAVGVIAALFAAQAIRGLLFGVAPHDPATLVSVAILMAIIGVGACWIPALRAARIDPAITMRS